MTPTLPTPPESPRTRPLIVTGLSVFFALGAVISATSLVALLFPGGILEPMWRLNPRAREQFQVMGIWGPILMGIVSTACGAAAVGLWRGRRFGYLLGITLLIVSLLGDLANAILGVEPRAWVGIPFAAAFLILLTTRSARAFFRKAL